MSARDYHRNPPVQRRGARFSRQPVGASPLRRIGARCIRAYGVGSAVSDQTIGLALVAANSLAVTVIGVIGFRLMQQRNPNVGVVCLVVAVGFNLCGEVSTLHLDSRLTRPVWCTGVGHVWGSRWKHVHTASDERRLFRCSTASLPALTTLSDQRSPCSGVTGRSGVSPSTWSWAMSGLAHTSVDEIAA